ncbi:MAG TPA: carboxypeptidase regulatory-like domain-containing protein [Acidobacteriaceae bacterium]|jgi:hypothetical protein|nr:carboxypeptidase regulatory-like domain-containing protein [Acidobacteriaceae bacterium]
MNSIRRLASARLRAPGSLLIYFGLLIAVMVLFTTVPAHAQQLTGTLSATAYDTSGAVVPGASVILKNSESGDVRRTVTDGSGYFTFTAVQPATYTISITAKGFTTWQLSGVVIELGATRTIPNIALKAGASSTTVEVVADRNVEVPLDTPEISNTLTANQIEDLSLGGRDAGELLKMMPGAAFTNGGSQGSAFNPQVTGTNSGPVGNYSLNGTQPYGAMAYMLDGANLVDPGNAGTQIANINEDMVQEVKVLTGSYGAEYAYGPVIFEAFSKSGGKNLHGEGYLYSRNSSLNSWESYAKQTYLADIASASGAAQASSLAAIGYPYEYFYYVGGNVGGPVVLPFINFNKNHDKLFFWGGYEYMIQHPNQNVAYYNEPTADQRNGIFDCGGSYGGGTQTNKYNGVPSLCGSTDEFEALESADPTIGYAYYMPSQRTSPGTSTVIPQDANWTQDASGNLHIPTTDLDPNITTLVSKAYPVPNLTANANNGWSNYAFSPSIPQNRWEATGKLDYAISDNTKLSGTYAYQSEVDQHPITIWWAPPNTLPYPTPVQANVNAQVILGNFTHQFNATTTNEAVFTLSRFINPNTTANNTRSLEGMSGITGLFGHTSTQMPNINNAAWGEALSSIDQEPFDGGFAGNGFGKLARVPQFYDTVSKVIGSHTAKAGFYWSQPFNSQSSGCDDGCSDNGQFNLGWPANYGTGNITADFLLGSISSYEQLSGVPLDNIKMNEWAIWAQDSWKANKQLTLNLGLRLDHVGQWYGEPAGNQVWVQSNYVDVNPAPANTGLEWNATNKNVPLSGFSSALFYPDPRIGLIYDLFGTGRTVLRAGFGSYHYQDSVNEATIDNVADGPKGVINFSSPTAFIGYANADTSGTPPTSVQENCWLCGNSVGGDLLGDNRTPNTLDWNVSVDQATKWQSLVELSYVANHTTGEEFNGGNGNINNLNNIPLNAFFAPVDPLTGTACSPSAITGETGCTANDFRPMHNYTNVYLLTHQSYEKYNSLQASWRKNGAKLNFQANYTFSKVMGIWDGDTSNGSGNGATVWPYTLGANYGPLDYDHTHIFNIWYIYNLPSPIHGNRLLGEVINDWKMSGYNTYQVGAFMQANVPNMNSSFPGGTSTAGLFTMPNGQIAQNQNASTWLGTSSVNDLMPLLTCNPAKGLSSGQHFNPNCFAAPSVGPFKDSAGVIHPGVEGPLHWPYLRYPGYFDNDLSIFKSFPTTESQRFELRVQAQNFVNHPNPQFDLDGNNDDIQVGYSALGGGNTETGTTGKPFHTTGQRLMMFSGKYYF